MLKTANRLNPLHYKGALANLVPYRGKSMHDVPMSAKDRGYLGSLGKHGAKAFGRNGIKAKVSGKLEKIASRMLGQRQGKQGKELRAKRQEEEVLFYTIEDDYVPESEPWETRFPDYYGHTR